MSKIELKEIRNKDNKITNYKVVVYRRDKDAFDANISREEAEILYGLYTYYGGNITARNVANEFPKYTLPEVKYLLRAFGITKDSIWAPKHLVEEMSLEELAHYRLNLKEKAAFKYADSRQEKDFKQTLNKFAQRINILEDKNTFIKSLCKNNIKVHINKKLPSLKNRDKTLIVYLSDLHIGSYNEPFGYLPLENYNEQEIKRRLSKIFSLINNNKYSDIYIVNLGDSVDSYNKETTRGGHELPGILSNKEQSQLYMKVMLWFFKQLKEYNKNIRYYCIGESNHDGDWGWLNNVALASQLNKLNINTYISNYPIDSFNINETSIIYLHGKDISNQFKGFPLVLNEKTENWFLNYLQDTKKEWKDRICVVKGDLHQSAFTNCNNFDYISCPSMYGSSQYIVANFGKTRWGIAYMEIDKQNNITNGIIRD